MENFILQLSKFEGPLDLLLYLIDKNRFTLEELEVCPIIDQYLDYVNQAQQLDISLAGEFLEMSSYLVWVKSCVLLPQDRVDEDEDELDPVRDLQEMLIAYRAIKEASLDLASRPQLFRDKFPRGGTEIEPGVARTTLASLLQSIDAIKARTRHIVIKKVKSRLSIREVMSRIHDILRRKGTVTVREASQGETRPEIIAAFLAALELSKASIAKLSQKGLFEPIVIRSREHE